MIRLFVTLRSIARIMRGRCIVCGAPARTLQWYTLPAGGNFEIRDMVCRKHQQARPEM